MIVDILLIVAGIALLTWSADRFIAGASSLARNLGVSPLIVGLTIVGFGTSAPEMLVSATAALRDAPGIAVGNAIGSNVANIGLIVGVTALISPLSVRSDTLRRELPLLIVAMLLALVLLLDHDLGRVDGLLLLGGLGLTIFWLVHLGLRTRRSDPIVGEFEAELRRPMPLRVAVAWTAVGLVLLLASSNVLVRGATGLATALGISDLVIGLTIVAVGTSLPELAASLVSALRREDDIAIGNVIGSNIFNVLGVLGLPGALQPGPVQPVVVQRDFPIMLGLTMVFFVMARGFRRPGYIGRLKGTLLLVAFVAYEVWLYAAA